MSFTSFGLSESFGKGFSRNTVLGSTLLASFPMEQQTHSKTRALIFIQFYNI